MNAKVDVSEITELEEKFSDSGYPVPGAYEIKIGSARPNMWIVPKAKHSHHDLDRYLKEVIGYEGEDLVDMQITGPIGS